MLTIFHTFTLIQHSSHPSLRKNTMHTDRVSIQRVKKNINNITINWNYDIQHSWEMNLCSFSDYYDLEILLHKGDFVLRIELIYICQAIYLLKFSIAMRKWFATWNLSWTWIILRLFQMRIHVCSSFSWTH